MALSDADGTSLRSTLPIARSMASIPSRSSAIASPSSFRRRNERRRSSSITPFLPTLPHRLATRRGCSDPDGSERFVEARADFILRDGERVAMISAIRDITERKRAERVQQDFIAMASHDLLTPVTVLRARAAAATAAPKPTTRRPSPQCSSRRPGWSG